MSQLSPKLSIIIVNWNTRDLLAACLESLRVVARAIPLEVIVVDNASTDSSADMVSSDFLEFTIIRNKENLGFAAANNIGLRAAKGQFLMVLNSDTELSADAASRMLEFIKMHSDVGMVGPKLVCPDGRLQINGQRFPTFLREVMGLTRLFRVFRRYHDKNLAWGREDFDANTEIDALAGACMLIRREVLDTAGYLDERFFMYYEDADWCLRIKQAGWKIWYLGEAEVVHVWAQSANKLGIPKANSEMYKAQYQYWRKHGTPFQATVLRLLSYNLLFIQAAKRPLRPVWRLFKRTRSRVRGQV